MKGYLIVNGAERIKAENSRERALERECMFIYR